MLVSQFDYHLPKEFIAQKPIWPRDCSRLLVYEKKTGKIQHRHFYDLPKFLRAGDLLVFNDTKVFKARLIGRVTCHPRPVSRYGVNSSGDPEKYGSKLDSFRGNDKNNAEIFLLKPLMPLKSLKSLKTLKDSRWEVLAKPGRKVAVGARVVFAKHFFCQVLEKKSDGRVIVRFNQPTSKVIKLADKYGHIPVPPYIKNEPDKLSDYQTIYAKHLGSVAAPTAGFHFTPRLLKKLKHMGVQTAFVTLHVGLGTFQPVKTKKIEEHQMHSEWAEISAKAAETINRAKQEGRRVIAVGTTTVRAVEGIAKRFKGLKVKRFKGEVDLFITPGFQFRVVDGLITNFHLPKSTLLMLVSAFAEASADKSAFIGSCKRTLQIYQKAVELKYRFYSFGDAMFIY